MKERKEVDEVTVDVEEVPYYRMFSSDFFEQLDKLVEVNFGHELWQDIIKAHDLAPPRRQKSMWEPIDGWALTKQTSIYEAVYTPMPWERSDSEEMQENESQNEDFKEKKPQNEQMKAKEPQKEELSEMEPQNEEIRETEPQSEDIRESEPQEEQVKEKKLQESTLQLEEVPKKEKKLQGEESCIDNVQSDEPEDNQLTHDIEENKNKEFKAKVAESPVIKKIPMDAMLKIARLARTIKRAAQKFKQLLHRNERPMQLKVHRATNLRSADWNGYSDPYVIITAFELVGVQTRYEIGNYMMTKTDIQYKTLNPVWDFSVILPHITTSTILCFTVVDYDFGTNPDFLGQTTLSMDLIVENTDLELQLGPLVHTPLYADGSPMSFGDRDTPGQGSLSITLGPLLCMASGALLVQPPAPLARSGWFSSAPNVMELYGLINDQSKTLMLYSAKDRATCTPTFTVPLEATTRILEEEEDWNINVHVKGMDPWRLSVDASEQEREKLHRRWIKALSRATHRPILIQRAPSQYEFKFVTV